MRINTQLQSKKILELLSNENRNIIFNHASPNFDLSIQNRDPDNSIYIESLGIEATTSSGFELKPLEGYTVSVSKDSFNKISIIGVAISEVQIFISK